jgi:hypothetical protein
VVRGENQFSHEHEPNVVENKIKQQKLDKKNNCYFMIIVIFREAASQKIIIKHGPLSITL